MIVRVFTNWTANSEKISETHFVSRFLHAIRKTGLLGELDCYIQHPVYSG